MAARNIPVLVLDNSDGSRFVSLVKHYLKANFKIEVSDSKTKPEAIFPSITEENEVVCFGVVPVAKLIMSSLGQSVVKMLTGETPEYEDAINEWMNVCSKAQFSLKTSEDIGHVEEALKKITFIGGTRISLADLALYASLANWLRKASVEEKRKHASVCRFFDHIQHLEGLRGDDCAIPLVDVNSLLEPALVTRTATTSVIPTTSPSPNFRDGNQKKNAGNALPKKEGKEKANKSDLKANKSDVKQVDEKKKEKAAAPAVEIKMIDGVACDVEGRPFEDPTRIELRVGFIQKAWEHPKAQRLYCEEIDIGLETPRSIASGLRAHKTIEEMQNQAVIVIANLPPKKMFKFDSHGMVLCASQGESVDFVRPPPGSKPGDLVLIEGHIGVHDNVLTVAESANTFFHVQPHLNSDGEGVAHYKTHKLLVGGKPCCSLLKNATLS